MGLLFIVGTIAIVQIFVQMHNTNNYCESIGYDSYELVGNDYFNCCKETPQIIDGVYEEGKECVAGGTYPAK